MRVSLTTLALAGLHLGTTQANPIGVSDEHLTPRAPVAQIITGLYGTNTALAAVVVHDTKGRETWRWTSNDAQRQNIPGDLFKCLKNNLAVPEAKWANGGNSIITVFNGAALMINHTPGKAGDKKITFGTCVNRGTLGNTHSLELVPDNKIAIATASHTYKENIQIFDLGIGLNPFANPIQKLDSIPAVHGLVWDKQANLLWAAGNNHPPTGKTPSSSALNAYAYKGGKFQTGPVQQHILSKPILLTTEWAGTQYSNWWDGGHDVIGVPHKRQLLISTDIDIHLFDIPSGKITSGESVAKKYLPGFTPVDRRVGSNKQSLPRSDIKCLSIDGDNRALYIQAGWKDVTSHHINFLQGGKLQPHQRYSQEVYKSRWFQDVPGWPKASSRH
ncbi:hypothetical protein NOR_06898 [Metarhizium rileyi]|uniref:WD40/YVTN repeat-like-containing domain protein n=1 Tax=Metarhizium rileyi (strain RCEF 4871) TaxID=1649241 RepID=A0A166ZDX7_METRR|nr:hypothetical protein NOR_06898 [Metarhizium rileyi RCEF 4871]